MSEATLGKDIAAAAAVSRRASRTSIAAIAWRNLWRNKRRTWLMAAGIGFAGLLVVSINALQVGTFELMIDNTTRFFAGHMQIQHPDYAAEPRLEHAIADASARVAALEGNAEISAVAPRAQAFILASSGERSFGALAVGVDPVREFAAIRHRATDGRYLSGPDEAYVGAVLAQNLGVGVGDEVVVLGNAPGGGVAAMVLTVVGTFATGQADFDRSQIHVRLAEFQEAFGLGDQVHAIALLLADPAATDKTAAALGDGDTVGVSWQQQLPDIHQLIELKYQSTYMIYALLVVLVTFSIVNAFIMTIFERTPEFGMLKALGMRPGSILGMLSWEALWMALLGLAATFAIAFPLVTLLSITGISFGDAYAEMTAQYMLPDRLYPSFSVRTAAEFGVVILAATQLAAAIPALRLRRLRVVDTLRAEE